MSKIAIALVVGMIVGGLVALAGVTAGGKHGRERWRDDTPVMPVFMHPRGGRYDAMDTGADCVGGGDRANRSDRT